MARKKIPANITITPEDKRSLEKLAEELGCTWGEKPNISALVRAIASGELIVCKDEDWQKKKQAAPTWQKEKQEALEQITEGIARLEMLL